MQVVAVRGIWVFMAQKLLAHHAGKAVDVARAGGGEVGIEVEELEGLGIGW